MTTPSKLIMIAEPTSYHNQNRPHILLTLLNPETHKFLFAMAEQNSTLYWEVSEQEVALFSSGKERLTDKIFTLARQKILSCLDEPHPGVSTKSLLKQTFLGFPQGTLLSNVRSALKTHPLAFTELH